MSWSRRFFFALDKLHISVAERYFILTLLLLLIGAGLFRIWAEPEARYKPEYYEKLERELKARKEKLASSDQEIMKRYGVWADSGDHLAINDIDISGFVGDTGPSAIHRSRADTFQSLGDSARTSPGAVEKGDPERAIQGYETDKNTGSDKRILINKASIDALTKLPGIGPVIAGRIVQYRVDHGPYQSINDLRNVKGIGEKRLEDIRPHIRL